MTNVSVLMGRLTKDPELKTTSNGISVCSFSLAVDRNYQRAGEERETDFINMVAWRSTAEFIAKYFKKGDMMSAVGSIQTRQYEDRDGHKRTAFEVVVNEVSFCGSKQSTEKPKTAQRTAQEVLDDELPF